MPTTRSLVLEVILAHWLKHFVPPTVREVQTAAGIKSTSTVHYYYRQLARRGEIVLARSKPVPVVIQNAIRSFANV